MRLSAFPLVAFSLVFLHLNAFASLGACPAGTASAMKIVVEYVPGSNFNGLAVFMSGHREFLSKQMKLGNLDSGGPFYGEKGVDGVLSIYNLGEFRQVEALLQEDPAISENVFSFKMHTWLQCSPKKTAPSP